MRINLLTNVFFPITNGVVHSVHLLAKGLSELDNNVNVIFSKHPQFSWQVANIYGINYNLINLPSLYLANVDYCIPNPLFIKKELKKLNLVPDVIQINHPFIIYRISKFFKDKNPKAKTIFVYHTQYEQYHHYVKFIPKILYQNFLNFHLREIFNFVDYVVFPSMSIKKTMEKKFYEYREKFHFISNPVDLDHIRRTDSENVQKLKDLYCLNNSFVLGFVGRLEKEKNLFALIDLFKKVVSFFGEKESKIKLLIVGYGREYSNLVSYVRNLGLQDRVIFTGKVDYKDISDYYRLIDLFVTLSLTEVKPLAYLESLAAGVPILAYKTFGADDLIINEYNGFLIENSKSSENQFINIIYSIYNNPELRQKLKLNAIKSTDKYNYLMISKQYLDIYLHL